MPQLIKRTIHYVIAILYHLGVFYALLMLERTLGWRRSVVVLLYHNINRRPPDAPISQMERGTLASDLEHQLAAFVKWYQPIDDARLASWLRKDVPLRQDGLLVTFDDAYEDNLTVAAPILKSMGIPGLIFVATDYVSSDRRFWWARLSETVRHIEPTHWKALDAGKLPRPVAEVIRDESLDTWDSRVRARRRIAEQIDHSHDVESVLQEMEQHLTERPMDSAPVLSWKQINTMAKNGFAFGGHTHTHPWLSLLREEDIVSEIASCYEVMEQRMGRAPISFAYPAGDYDSRVLSRMEKGDFKLAFTTRRGIVLKSSFAYELPRLSPKSIEPSRLQFLLVILKLCKYLPNYPTKWLLSRAA